MILNDILSTVFYFQISYNGSGEGESDDSEGENQELAQIDRGKCTMPPDRLFMSINLQLHV